MEQGLIEDLVIESIQIYGQDMYYLPKTVKQLDRLYGEGLQASEFNDAIFVELYIKNVEGFQGDGDFLSKFNLEIRDRMTFTIARRTFANEVGSQLDLVRPREGDVIYFPLNRKFFQIKFVEHEAIFYQLGALQTFDLVCELMEFSNEVFNTGIPEIDEFTVNNNTTMELYHVSLEDGAALNTEQGAQLVLESYDIEELDLGAENNFIQSESDNFLDFTEINPFSESRF
jgi:hypothetical protein